MLIQLNRLYREMKQGIILWQEIVHIYNNTKKDEVSSESHLLDRKAAAKFLGVKEHTLAVWATTHKYHLPYIKVGSLVKYRLRDLEAFLEQNLHKDDLD